MTLFQYFQQFIPSTGMIELDIIMFFLVFIMFYIFILKLIGVIVNK